MDAHHFLETLTIVLGTAAVTTSLLAHALGFSVALGAFVAGSLLAESGEQEQIEHLVQPVRDVFAAICWRRAWPSGAALPICTVTFAPGRRPS